MGELLKLLIYGKLAAGQYNDPNRFDATPNEDGVTVEYLRQGKVERSISLFRTR